MTLTKQRHVAIHHVPFLCARRGLGGGLLPGKPSKSHSAHSQVLRLQYPQPACLEMKGLQYLPGSKLLTIHILL